MAKGPEAQTQALILDYLQACGVMAYRMNTGAMRSEYKGKARFMRFGVPGMADILAFNYGTTTQRCEECPTLYTSLWIKVLWIECKAPKGKQSDLQKSFQQQVERQGHRYVLAYSLDDVTAVL